MIMGMLKENITMLRAEFEVSGCTFKSIAEVCFKILCPYDSSTLLGALNTEISWNFYLHGSRHVV